VGELLDRARVLGAAKQNEQARSRVNGGSISDQHTCRGWRWGGGVAAVMMVVLVLVVVVVVVAAARQGADRCRG